MSEGQSIDNFKNLKNVLTNKNGDQGTGAFVKDIPGLSKVNEDLPLNSDNSSGKVVTEMTTRLKEDLGTGGNSEPIESTINTKPLVIEKSTE